MKLEGNAKKFNEFAQGILTGTDLETYKQGIDALLEKANNEQEQMSVLLASFFGNLVANVIDLLFIFARDLKDEKEKVEFLDQGHAIISSQIKLLFDHSKKIYLKESDQNKEE